MYTLLLLASVAAEPPPEGAPLPSPGAAHRATPAEGPAASAGNLLDLATTGDARGELLHDGAALLLGSFAAPRYLAELGAGERVEFDWQAPVRADEVAVQVDADAGRVTLEVRGAAGWVELPTAVPAEPGMRWTFARVTEPIDGLALRADAEPVRVSEVVVSRGGRPHLAVRAPAPPRALTPQGQARAGVALALAAVVALAACTVGRWGTASGFAAWASAIVSMTATAGPVGGFVAAGLGGLAVRRWRSAAGPLLASGLAVTLVCAWTGFGHARGTWLHPHDVFHYYLGAAHFEHLRYTNLYTCAIEAAGSPDDTAVVRDLATHGMRRVSELAAGLDCARTFGPERWSRFGADVAVFRSLLPGGSWHQVFLDHGFNASSVWLLLAAPLAAAPASPRLLEGLSLLDPAAMLVAIGVFARAFGWRPTLVFLAVATLTPAWGFAWVGGGFGRAWWLAALVGAIAAARAGAIRTAGALTALAAGLVVFPAYLLLGPLLGCVLGSPAVRGQARTFVASAAVAGVGLFLASGLAHGPAAWTGFAANMVTHLGDPSANLVGLPAALGFRPGRLLSDLWDASLNDPVLPWARARAADIAAWAPLRLGLLGVGVLAVAREARRQDLATLLPLGLVAAAVNLELSSYYWVWAALLAAVATRPPAILALLALPVAGQVLHLGTTSADEVPFVVMSMLVALVTGAFALGLAGPPPAGGGERSP